MLTLVLLAIAWAPAPARAQQDLPDIQAARAEVDRLTVEGESLWIEIQDLFQRYAEAEGEERLILDAQVDWRTQVWRPLVTQLIEELLALEEA
jgi:hypothetical protein